MRNVQQTDSNISSDASPVIISSTVYRLHHMSTCSYINQDCFSSAGKKNYLHLPVVSDSQTGWKQDEPTSDNIPCLADTLYMPGEMEARHTLLIINWFYRCSSTVTKWKHGVHSRHLKTWIPQSVCKLFIPIQSYSYIFDMQESYGVTLWHTVTLPKPLSLFWACGGLLFWLLPQNQYPLCGGDFCLQQATILMGPSWYLRMWWFTTDRWHQMTSSSHLTRCLNIWLTPCFDRWLPLKNSIWSMDAQWNPIIAA